MDFVKPCASNGTHCVKTLEFYRTFVLSFRYFDYLNLFYFAPFSAKVVMEADLL